jgi:Zn-dependent protease
MRLGTVIVAAAGPLSNLLFALLCTAALAIWFRVNPADFGGSINPGVDLLAKAIQVNAGLFFFNLLPIPPLDGSRVLANLLPRRFDPFFAGLERYSFLLFILLLMPPTIKIFAYPAHMLVVGLFGIIRG